MDACPPEFPIVSATHQCMTCEQIDPDRPFHVPGENECLPVCPSTAPYYATERDCLAACPRWNIRAFGGFACGEAPAPADARHSVSFAGETHTYFLRAAVSYASLELGVRRRASAFLETGAALAGLSLRAAADEGFAPAVFFRAERVLGCELQLAGKAPDDSFILGVTVRVRPLLIRCALGAVFQTAGTYRVA